MGYQTTRVENMKKKIELLAPGGDVDSIKAAISAGADAVYCGLDKFNARNRAENIDFKNLKGILRLAHNNSCKVFITLNIIIVESEIPDLIRLLNKLINTSIDGVIIQDLGLFYLLSKYFKGFKIHASTQLTTHNEGQIEFLNKLNAQRVNLSRELNLHEIRDLSTAGKRHGVMTEVFVHGSNCICFSGICYISSVQAGNSGNRGRCSQPCRDMYETTPQGKSYPLNLRDNSAYLYLEEIALAGADSIKIEGRIKKFHYVYTVVEAYRKQLDRLYNRKIPDRDNTILYKVFNRDFSSSFLRGEISSDMFIDNPRDHSALHLAEANGQVTPESIETARKDIYDERTEIINQVKSKIDLLNIEKAPLEIFISGQCGTPLKVDLRTPCNSFTIYSESNLVIAVSSNLDYESLFKRFAAVNDTEYFIKSMDLKGLHNSLLLPFKELTSIKKRILSILNDSLEYADPVELPALMRHIREKAEPDLFVLISSMDDVYLSEETSSSVCFQLPDCFKNQQEELTELFRNNEKMIPWFPSVLIGEDYTASVEFLEELRPELIVSNNTGIAFEAWKKGIPWIAGPFLNLVNSYSLLCLKENFNCSGAFISNEINKNQIRSIKSPENFDLYYSIYHPIELMTARQCLFHQVTGCEKESVDENCLSRCEKSASIKNIQGESLLIRKDRGNYHRIYNEVNFLNPDIVDDIPDLFSGFLIDLRDIETSTANGTGKSETVRLFESFLNGSADSKKEILSGIYPVTNSQYKKGI